MPSSYSCDKGCIQLNGCYFKDIFVPTSVKAVIVIAAILVLATVVIVNWNKTKPVFNQIVNVFVDNAKKLANTVRNIFNSIYQTTVKSKSDKVQKKIDDLVEGAETGRETSGKSEQYHKKGGFIKQIKIMIS